MIERILIVGFGSIGKRHLKIAKEMFAHADIRVLRSSSSKTVEHASSDIFFFSIEEALLFKPQISVIANPSPFHLDISIKLANIGSHLLIEKPMAECSDRVFELIEVVSKKNLVVLVGYNLRYFSSLQRFKSLIHEGILGAVFSIHSEVGQYLPAWRKDVDYRGTVSAQSTLGGGVLLELSHEMDYLVWVFGKIKWLSATNRRQSNLEIDVDDTSHLLIEFMEVSGKDSVLCSLSMDFLRHDKTRSCTVIGEKATLRWNGILGLVEIYYPDSGSWKELILDKSEIEDSYIREWKYFLNCITNNTHSINSILESQYVLNIIEAAKLSNESNGKRVNVKEVYSKCP
jgi:predicted dehydrogenase